MATAEAMVGVVDSSFAVPNNTTAPRCCRIVGVSQPPNDDDGVVVFDDGIIRKADDSTDDAKRHKDSLTSRRY